MDGDLAGDLAGDMDAVVRSLSAVSRLLGSSDLSIHVSLPLIHHVRWSTQLLVNLGVLRHRRVTVSGSYVTSTLCTKCNGTGKWHQRGVPATDAKWLLCSRCRGDRREFVSIKRLAVLPESGDVKSLVIDYRGGSCECDGDAGEFNCPTLSDAGSALAVLAGFTLRFMNAQGGISKEQPYLLDFSHRLDFACPVEECKRMGGVIKEHVGLLVGACECWHGGIVARDVISKDLHDWLWFERALHYPIEWEVPSIGIDRWMALRRDVLVRHYKNKKIGSWLDDLSR